MSQRMRLQYSFKVEIEISLSHSFDFNNLDKENIPKKIFASIKIFAISGVLFDKNLARNFCLKDAIV